VTVEQVKRRLIIRFGNEGHGAENLANETARWVGLQGKQSSYLIGMHTKLRLLRTKALARICDALPAA
jgi:hypothetical protein